MNATSEIFPIFVRAEYQEGQAFARFQSEAQRSANNVKQEFQALGKVVGDALSGGLNSAGSLNLGVDELRAATVAQQQRATAAREVADATLRAAKADGEFTKEMREGVQAARLYATEQERLLESLRAQIPLQTAIQTELNQTASAVSVLVGENLKLAQAEAARVNGGNLLNAIQRETGAGLQKTANSARESAQAFNLLFEAQTPDLYCPVSPCRRSAARAQSRLPLPHRSGAKSGAVARPLAVT